MAKESYTCFYSHPPFWAVAALDFGNDINPPDFSERMQEIVFDEDKDGLHVRIARDGEIQLRKNELEAQIAAIGMPPGLEKLTDLWAEYLKLLNVFYLSLDMACIDTQKAAIFDFQEITRKDAYRVCNTDGKFSSAGLPSGSITSHYQMGRFLIFYNRTIPMAGDMRISFRWLITEQTIAVAVASFRMLVAEKSLCDKADTLSKAISHYKLGDLKNCIVLCWFVLERCLNDLYKEYLNSKSVGTGGVVRINAERRKFLTGRDYTAAIISSELELDGIISLDELNNFDRIRRLRNDVAHNLPKQKITMGDCSSALQFAASFLFKGKIADPKLNLSLSAQGL